jgi:hypothetical protein
MVLRKIRAAFVCTLFTSHLPYKITTIVGAGGFTMHPLPPSWWHHICSDPGATPTQSRCAPIFGPVWGSTPAYYCMLLASGRASGRARRGQVRLQCVGHGMLGWEHSSVGGFTPFHRRHCLEGGRPCWVGRNDVPLLYIFEVKCWMIDCACICKYRIITSLCQRPNI